MVIDVCPDCGALIDEGYLECPVCDPDAYKVNKNDE
jgi:RNA polymerase subunit RPABC4/transcription elongation factor Spt4